MKQISANYSNSSDKIKCLLIPEKTEVACRYLVALVLFKQ